MTDSPLPTTTVATTKPRRRRRLDLQGAAAGTFLAIVILAAILAPWIGTGDPNAQDLTATLQGPSAHHLLGTDNLGRDLWTRLVFGARVSVLASAIAAGVAMVIGIPIGIAAGYFGRWVDAVLMRVTDTLLSFPAIVLAVGIGAALGPGLVNSMTAVGVVFSPILARLARGQVMAVKQRLFVSAAWTYGTTNLRIVRRHILPNIVQPLIVQIALIMGMALLAEASLSFLGLGVQPPTASWGTMLHDAFQFISMSPGAIYAPGLAIALTALSFNALGDSLRDRFDPHRRG